MLAANVCAADFITRGKQPGLFRVHEGPTPEKVEILRNYLRTLGISARVSDEPTPAELAALAEATKDRPDAEQVHAMLLRSMQQAIYSPYNSGHFGLAYEAYAHFTSPIRRYPDLLVHRVIKAILRGEKYQLPVLPTPGEAQEKLSQRLQKNAALRAPTASATAKPRKNQAELLAWQAAGLHCSANERRADEASRDVEAWLKCKYMRDFLGEEFSGVVSSVTSFGLFVTLDAMYVEGLVHITELGGDYFKFDEARQELRGERTGVRFALGSKVQVQVIRVDLDGRRIDFRLLRAGQEVLQKAAAGKKRTSAKRKTANSIGNDVEDAAQAQTTVTPDEHVWQPRQKRSSRSKSASKPQTRGSRTTPGKSAAKSSKRTSATKAARRNKR